MCLPDYMHRVQKDVNEKMRAILVDWLVDVHIKFKLRPETLFLSVNIVDRYLSQVSVSRQALQLVGVVAMLIASKYEEIYPPEIKDFAYVTDKAYTKAEILRMEGDIISRLNFKFTHMSSLGFLERYCQLAELDQRGRYIARYALELALVNYRMVKYQPSAVACSAIYLVHKLQKKKECWDEVMQRNSYYQEAQLRTCAKDLCALIQKAKKSNLKAVTKKFSSSRYLEVGKIELEKI